MTIDPHNLYHPFKDTSFGILSAESSGGNYIIGELIEDVNLYYQPVQKPILAAIFLVLKALLLAVGEYLLVKVYYLMKKENGLVKNITKVLVCAEMIFWPLWVVFSSSTDFVHPMYDVAGQWFCEAGQFLFVFLGTIMFSHSFMSALLRYFFIVQQEKTNAFGKEKVRRIILVFSILLPLFIAVWKKVDGAELASMSFVNKCNGKHHKVFLRDTSTLDVSKRIFCGIENHNATGTWNQILSWVRLMSCIVNKIVIVIIGLNITEGILYYKILTHMNR